MGKKPKKVSLKEKKKIKMRSVDMPAVKLKIKQEFLQTFGSIQSNGGNCTNYEYWYSKYLTEEFNPHYAIMMITFINSIANIPPKIKNEMNINKDILSIIKELMMNEFEITLFTINLDLIGWDLKGYKPKLHWLLIGLLTKAQLNRSIEIIMSHYIQLNHDFSDSFIKWKINSNCHEVKNMTVEIFDRYRLLNKPFNSFCEKKFVDYNSIVDKIVQSSQPYGEDNKGIMIMKEENAFDLLNIPSFQPTQPILLSQANENINANGNANHNNNNNNNHNPHLNNSNSNQDFKMNTKRHQSISSTHEDNQELFPDSMTKNYMMDYNYSSQKPLYDYAQNLILSQSSMIMDQNSFLSENNLLLSNPNNNKNSYYKQQQLLPFNEAKLFSSQNSAFLNINLSQLSNNF